VSLTLPRGQLQMIGSKAEERRGREVNVTAYSPEEFREKIKSRDHFLAAVLRGGKQFVKGSQSDLDEIVGR
jgi:hypothetical protein